MLNILKKMFLTQEIEDPKEKYSLKRIEEFVEENINNLVISSLDELGKSYQEIRNVRRRKEIFKNQLDLCGLGDISAKLFVKSWISDLITQKYNVNENNIIFAINFDFPSTYDQFHILLYEYFKDYRYNALKKFITINNLDKLKEVNEELMYAITKEDIQYIFEKEIKDTRKIKFSQKLDILVQRIYEDIQGLSVIDEIRDMNSDGISIGISGIPIEFISKINDMNIKNNEHKKYPMSYDSVWLYFSGKEISLNFMGFGNQRQLERVCRKIYRFNNKRQFTQADGSIVSSMADISRVTVFRPPHAESWAAFIRKFDIDGDLDELITNENSDIVKELTNYIMKAKDNMCFSGQQGAGKTTMLVGSVKKLYANSTLRVWEDYFETFFRIKTPFRNILTIRKTEDINGEQGLDSLKKSNGQITVISESADDQSKAYVIKGALAASEAVYWTDHSVSADELVETHRNAFLNLGLFRDETLAEQQVLRVLQWNMHLENNDVEGYRYIRRLTEFIRVDTNEYSTNDDEKSYYENTRLYYEKKTNSKKYKAINIIEFDEEKKKYIIKHLISEERQKYILSRLRDEDKQGFKNLLIRMKGELNV
ncbi:TPA: Flp pilus assembly complex ATPase component TadA [Clostridium botulinum]|uniref:Pilus assembly protein, ATPase of CpaF family n=1 Tax=Clostridium botulinum TaxID=1491 RepID=A0A126JJ19_CLOBO|nr:ATPase, T2SS/T4P/T4SS family [Clostridium botulinum]ALT05823.1 pilus assembly protein, ATPase of CpaF family [Clostridium botulinum]HBJ2623091.1 Flp pilus assembly complex ATPase component TadA [Clostridium botulinum]